MATHLNENSVLSLDNPEGDLLKNSVMVADVFKLEYALWRVDTLGRADGNTCGA